MNNNTARLVFYTASRIRNSSHYILALITKGNMISNPPRTYTKYKVQGTIQTARLPTCYIYLSLQTFLRGSFVFKFDIIVTVWWWSVFVWGIRLPV